MNRTILSYENVYKKYQLGETAFYAAKNVSFSIEMGDFAAIVGSSGSGKSTLLHMGASIDKPSQGTIRLLDQKISDLDDRVLSRIRNEQVGFVFQSFNLIPVVNVFENIEYPCYVMKEKRDKNKQRDYIDFLLENVGMVDKKYKRPSQLSGGERQRVAIARALVNKPKIVFADEPTANLDHKTGESIMNLLLKLNEELGTTFFFSTHDQNIMEKARTIIRIEDGEIV